MVKFYTYKEKYYTYIYFVHIKKKVISSLIKKKIFFDKIKKLICYFVKLNVQLYK